MTEPEAASATRKKRTIAREMVAEAARELGGVDALIQWIEKEEKNEQVFWGSIFPRLIAVDTEEEAGVRLARALTWQPPTQS